MFICIHYSVWGSSSHAEGIAPLPGKYVGFQFPFIKMLQSKRIFQEYVCHEAPTNGTNKTSIHDEIGI